MKNLGQRYVQYVNRTYRRTGTLWEGRFRSCLVDAEPYLFACQRYVELNPVRAAMVRHPRQYRWSSYRVNAEGKASDLIVPHEQYHRLGRSAQARQQAYRALFEAARQEVPVEDIRRATNGGFVLGRSRFAQEIAHALGRRVERGKPGRPARAEEPVAP